MAGGDDLGDGRFLGRPRPRRITWPCEPEACGAEPISEGTVVMQPCRIDSDAVEGLAGGDVRGEGITPSTGGERRSIIGLFPGECTVSTSVKRVVLSIGVTGVISFSRV